MFVRQVGADRDPRSLRRADLEHWLDSRTVSAATLRLQFSTLRVFFNWLVATERIKRHPMAGLDPPKEPRRLPRALRPDAVAAVMARLDARGLLVVSLMVQEGLRRAEVAGLQLDDIDFDRRLMRVIGKGGHERVLPITTETFGYLLSYLAEHPASAGPLVRSYGGGPHPEGRALTPDYIGDLVGEWMSAAGVKARARDGVSAHALRHTAATDMLRAGAHLLDVKTALGHTSLTTTQRYLPWVVGDLRDAMGGRTYRKPVR